MAVGSMAAGAWVRGKDSVGPGPWLTVGVWGCAGVAGQRSRVYRAATGRGKWLQAPDVQHALCSSCPVPMVVPGSGDLMGVL